jgi:uncharacterized protein (DUF302 family)
MTHSTFVVEHVSVVAEKPFEEVARALESQLGRFDPAAYASIAESRDRERARAVIQAMLGPSGFMLFGTIDQAWLPRHMFGLKQKAVQYALGNPLFALQLTQHDVRAALYAPMRVLLYETAEGRTRLEYDRPSSIFRQFRNLEIDAFSALLDLKMEALAAAVTRAARTPAHS